MYMHVHVVHVFTCRNEVVVCGLENGQYTVSGQREYAKSSNRELSWVELLLGKRPKF